MNPLEELVLKRIEDIGRSREKLSKALGNDIFKTLSKYDPFWKPTSEEWQDRLHSIRGEIQCLQDEICDVFDILVGDE